MKVCIGGTFDKLHKGHKILLKKAFELAGETGIVFIGLATDDLTRNKKDVKPLIDRLKILKQYLSKEEIDKQAVIVPITNKYGLTLKEDFDAIVISPETEKNAMEINKKRVLNGKKPLKIIRVDFVLAEDGKPISSTRINNKEIDENGNLLQRD
ncbi:MAG: cytidyltransferase [Thermoplasmatales archaeon SG8-52-3]|nr:MAG: cytidyltransferase [Thermoplasmatales archaeon SG8-52-3]